MAAIDDPFENLSEDDFPLSSLDSTITEGATVVDVVQHPVYGTTYRCRAWMAHYPWTLSFRSGVTAHRGDPFANPVQLPGEARIVRLRRNGANFKEIAVGFDGGEVLFDIGLDVDLSIEVGDTLVFQPVR